MNVKDDINNNNDHQRGCIWRYDPQSKTLPCTCNEVLQNNVDSLIESIIVLSAKYADLKQERDDLEMLIMDLDTELLQYAKKPIELDEDDIPPYLDLSGL